MLFCKRVNFNPTDHLLKSLPRLSFYSVICGCYKDASKTCIQSLPSEALDPSLGTGKPRGAYLTPLVKIAASIGSIPRVFCMPQDPPCALAALTVPAWETGWGPCSLGYPALDSCPGDVLQTGSFKVSVLPRSPWKGRPACTQGHPRQISPQTEQTPGQPQGTQALKSSP